MKPRHKLSTIKQGIKNHSITKSELSEVRENYIKLSGFAEACYNDNSLDELTETAIDVTSLEDWNLTDSEYRNAVKEAFLKNLQVMVW